jgi:Zn-dependent metalloprotease
MAGILLPFNSVLAQQSASSLDNTAFTGAEIQYSRNTNLPEDIKMETSGHVGKNEFFTSLRRTFKLSEGIQFVPEKEHVGALNYTHIRYKLHYKGLELNQTQYMLHLKDDKLIHAHGRLVDLRDVDIRPSLSKQEAYEFARTHLGISEFEARGKSKLHAVLRSGNEALTEDGRLLLSSGFSGKTGENYRLVYRFDVILNDPVQRYDVDIDAHSGELVGKYPTLFHENIPTRGHSLYNDTVDIVVSDSLALEKITNPGDHWHLTSWNAYEDSGLSWWTSDTSFFSPGGYMDNWHEVLTTEAIILSGPNPRLEFIHRYKIESPDGASDYNDQYDGWDGINIRISLDQGESWSVLSNPEPAYTSTSLWSFGGIHGEGPGIPGWAGTNEDWTRVSCDLSDYRDDTVMIRFEFASDGGYSSLDDPGLFGWQIDEIVVLSDSGIHLANTGASNNISSKNLIKLAGFSEGKYRLRETSRGGGILTLNAESGEGYSTYVDYVQDQIPVVRAENRVGVGIHWATEKTYDFYLDTFDRNSFDNQGGAIVSYGDWKIGDDRNNAFWSGGIAAYGAGDGETFSSFGAIDVVAHEITHGVTQHTANLVYQGESGALNESFSDIFGTVVEYYAEGRDKGDWLVGEDVIIGPGAIRSMENPNEFRDPDTYRGKNWVNPDDDEDEDNGGVHTNSGVQNFWYYLLSEGGAGTNDDFLNYNVEGIGLDDATAIAYRNLTLYLLPDSEYHEAALYSVQSARDLYGEDSRQVYSTLDAWDAVGIYLYPRLVSSGFSLPYYIKVGNSDSASVFLTNEGIEALSIYDLQLSDSGNYSLSVDQNLPLELGRSESLELSVKFTPAYDGTHKDTLTVISSDAKDSIRHIPLTGYGFESATSLPEKTEFADAELLAYPNPFSDHLLISFKLPDDDLVRIEILDITGRRVFSSTWNAGAEETREIRWNEITQGRNRYGSGLYLLKLHTSHQVFTTKVIRE